MKEIYNEGRVVGYSAFEIYVRQLLSLNPEATPMNEREWLTATLANNSSMILRIPAGTPEGFHDFVLPSDCALCTCTNVYGSVFQGKVELDEEGVWATKVTDYGRLISNKRTRFPLTPGLPDDVPAQDDPGQLDPEFVEQCKNYLYIKSALVIQPGEWENFFPLVDEGSKFVIPDFTKNGFVRIGVSKELETDVYILIHGFVDKVILTGEISYPVREVSIRPQDGDFLGPQMYPWACPVVLLVTSDVQQAMRQDEEEKYAEIHARIDKEIRDREDECRQLKDVDQEHWKAIRVLQYRVKYLGSLFVVEYDAGMITEDGEPLETEDGEQLIAHRIGTVAQMWDEQGGDRLLFYTPTFTEENDDLLTEDEEVLMSPKIGTIEDMIAEGGEV